MQVNQFSEGGEDFKAGTPNGEDSAPEGSASNHPAPPKLLDRVRHRLQQAVPPSARYRVPSLSVGSFQLCALPR